MKLDPTKSFMYRTGKQEGILEGELKGELNGRLKLLTEQILRCDRVLNLSPVQIAELLICDLETVEEVLTSAETKGKTP